MEINTGLAVVIVNIGVLLSGYVGMTVWKDKGGDPGGAYIVGALLGGLGVFFLVLLKPGQREIARVARSRERVPCPHCVEFIRREAHVCPYCGRDVAAATDGAS